MKYIGCGWKSALSQPSIQVCNTLSCRQVSNNNIIWECPAVLLMESMDSMIINIPICDERIMHIGGAVGGE